MKKIMILMLSLAVLFSFAACDNSSNTPVDPDQTTGDGTDYAYLAATKVASVIGEVSSKFAVDADFMSAGKLTVDATNYSVDLATNSLKYETRTPAVNGLGEEYTIITVSGKDVTSATTAAAQTGKTIMLDRYTISFSKVNPEAGDTGNLDSITGEISGDMIGLVTVTGLLNNEITDSTTIAISAYGKDDDPARMSAIVVSGAAKNIPTVTLAFYPDEVSDIASLSYLGHDVDKDDFVAYINSKRVNTALKAAYAVDTAVTSNAAYREFQEKQFGYDVYNVFNSVLTAASSNEVVAKVTTPTASSYNAGASTSSATFTFTNTNPESPITFAKSTTPSLVYALKSGDSFTITFEGSTGSTPGQFTPSKYTLAGTLAVYKSETFNGSQLNEAYDEIIVALEGSCTGVTIKEGSPTSAGTSATATGLTAFKAPTDGTITTTFDVNVLPGVAGTGDEAKLNVLSEVEIDCPVTNPNA